MELSGKVFKAMPVESGEGKNGVWKKQQIIIEIDNGKYPKKVAASKQDIEEYLKKGD